VAAPAMPARLHRRPPPAVVHPKCTAADSTEDHPPGVLPFLPADRPVY